MRLSRMQFIIMSNTARTHFSSWERTFAHCCCAHMSGVPLKPRQANENKTVAQTCPTEAEMVPIMIVDHRRRGRRNVLLSRRSSRAPRHGCYFIIPSSTSMVNLFHYVAVSVHGSAVCTCRLLRSGVYQPDCPSCSQTGDKARGPRGSKGRISPQHASWLSFRHSGRRERETERRGMTGKTDAW